MVLVQQIYRGMSYMLMTALNMEKYAIRTELIMLLLRSLTLWN